MIAHVVVYPIFASQMSIHLLLKLLYGTNLIPMMIILMGLDRKHRYVTLQWRGNTIVNYICVYNLKFYFSRKSMLSTFWDCLPSPLYPRPKISRHILLTGYNSSYLPITKARSVQFYLARHSHIRIFQNVGILVITYNMSRPVLDP